MENDWTFVIVDKSSFLFSKVHIICLFYYVQNPVTAYITFGIWNRTFGKWDNFCKLVSKCKKTKVKL